MMSGYGNGYHMGGYGGYSGFGWNMIIPIILIGVIIYALFKVFGSKPNSNNHNTALDELNIKYVNGEITEEEYLRKKKMIS